MQGSAIGVASVFITVLAHSLGAGALANSFPGLATTAFLFIAATMIGAVALDARKGWIALSVLMFALQVFFHVILVVTDGHHAHGFVPSASMIFTHLLAALTIAALICGADGIVNRWLAFWSMLCRRVDAPVALEPRRLATSPPRVIDATAVWSPARSLIRRGPPLLP